MLSGVTLGTTPKYTESSENSSKPQSTTWSSSSYVAGRNTDAWFSDKGKFTIQDRTDIEDGPNYQVRYMKGRFNPETLPYGDFDTYEEAGEYAGLIVNGEVDIDDLLS